MGSNVDSIATPRHRYSGDTIEWMWLMTDTVFNRKRSMVVVLLSMILTVDDITLLLLGRLVDELEVLGALQHLLLDKRALNAFQL